MKFDRLDFNFSVHAGWSLLFLALLPLSAQADVVNLAKAPLYTTTTSSVKPNLMFILDNSGSMGDDTLPDDVPGNTRYGYWSSQCNGLAYNPNVTYTVPVKSDGSDMTTPSFTAACSNGFSGTCSVNLTNNYYYKYSGSQPANAYKYTTTGVVTTSDFYKECNSSIGNTPGSSVFTKVTVSATSGPGSTDERQNYANWYSFYRTRMMMMKTAVGQAFKNIDSKFRVGFSTISYTGTDSTNAGFLAINDFDSGTGNQKDKFYTKLYAASGSSYTPLRGALSKAGRIYAGKIGTDPMQYSCQQNFTLLSTDGYWNTSSESASYGPFGLDGSTPVGQQDGTALRPMKDSASSVVTETTPTTTTTIVTTPQTVLDRSVRTVTSTTFDQQRINTYTRTRVTTSTTGCSGGKVKVRTRTYNGTATETEITTSAQLQEQISTTTQNSVATTTSTVTTTVVTTDGGTPVTTVSNPVVSTNTNNTVTSGPTAGTWTNVGSPAVNVNSTFSPTVSVGTISWGTAISDITGTTCTSTAASDQITATSNGAWTTLANPSPVTSGTTHDSAYPQTTNGSATTGAPTTVVGTTVTTTSTTSGQPNTLADVAMYYYQTDLRYPNNCTSGTSGLDLCPKDGDGKYSPNVPGNGVDNNTKPHMTTFTLGLGVDGVLDYSPTYSTDTSGDYVSIKTGSKNWPDPKTSTAFPYGNTSDSVIERIDDLWHAAVNGRGTYFSAKNPASLVNSLNGALAGMTTRLGYGTAAATSNLAPIAGDNALYVASYTTAQWTGNLVAESIDVETGAVNPTASWCVENVSADTTAGTAACTGVLPNQIGASTDTRTIYFNQNGAFANFVFSALSSTQKAWFDTSKLSQWSSTYQPADKTLATGTSLVEFLRGQTQYESQTGSVANLYRDRLATLGDIVDSLPVYLGKPTAEFTDAGYADWKNSTARQNRAGTIFVGANDGMLHAFNSKTGAERWAFAPTPVMPNMYWLADLTYTTNHHNYANGRLVYSDVCVKDCSDASKADWRTILFGGLNGGGRGYFAIDVTDPTSPSLLWEFTSLNDADVGYSFGNPIAAKKADGTWVVLLSSGYDNVKLNNGDPFDAGGTGKGFLFVLDPLSGTVIDKIPTNAGDVSTPSGLGRISYWSENPEQDATALYAYGGDLLGNLWRFDINTKAVVKLASLTDTLGNPQPITTRPELSKVNGSRVVYVSTGKYLEAADLDSTKFKTQSVYAMVDAGTTYTSPRTQLIQQTLVNAKPIRTLSNVNPVNIPSDNGWFVDLPDSGERSNVDMTLAQGTLIVPTNVPTNGVCEAGGYSWMNFFDYRTGGYVSGSDGVGLWTGNDLTTGVNIVWIKGHPVLIRTGSGSAPKLIPNIPFNPGSTSGVIGHRVSWREIFTK